jgi:phage shock protein A
MTPKEVLSVLGQMELELTQVLAQKRGLQQIREALQAYEEVQTSLATLQANETALKKKLAGLDALYTERVEQHRTALAEERACCERGADALKLKQQEVAEQMQALDAQLAERERAHQVRLTELDEQVSEKSKQLTTLTNQLQALKRSLAVA